MSCRTCFEAFAGQDLQTHALVLDGVFARDGLGPLRFHPAPALDSADGTTHLPFTPTALLERLAVLVPRPRVNLLLYHGVLAPPRVGATSARPRPIMGLPSPSASSCYRLERDRDLQPAAKPPVE